MQLKLSQALENPKTPPIGLLAKLQNKENTTFLLFLKMSKLSFALEKPQNGFKAYSKTFITGGEESNLSKILLTNRKKNFTKWPKLGIQF